MRTDEELRERNIKRAITYLKTALNKTIAKQIATKDHTHINNGEWREAAERANLTHLPGVFTGDFLQYPCQTCLSEEGKKLHLDLWMGKWCIKKIKTQAQAKHAFDKLYEIGTLEPPTEKEQGK